MVVAIQNLVHTKASTVSGLYLDRLLPGVDGVQALQAMVAVAQNNGSDPLRRWVLGTLGQPIHGLHGWDSDGTYSMDALDDPSRQLARKVAGEWCTKVLVPQTEQRLAALGNVCAATTSAIRSSSAGSPATRRRSPIRSRACRPRCPGAMAPRRRARAEAVAADPAVRAETPAGRAGPAGPAGPAVEATPVASRRSTPAPARPSLTGIDPPGTTGTGTTGTAGITTNADGSVSLGTDQNLTIGNDSGGQGFTLTENSGGTPHDHQVTLRRERAPARPRHDGRYPSRGRGPGHRCRRQDADEPRHPVRGAGSEQCRPDLRRGIAAHPGRVAPGRVPLAQVWEPRPRWGCR